MVKGVMTCLLCALTNELPLLGKFNAYTITMGSDLGQHYFAIIINKKKIVYLTSFEGILALVEL